MTPVVTHESSRSGEAAGRAANATFQRVEGLQAGRAGFALDGVDEADGHLLLRLGLPDELGFAFGLLQLVELVPLHRDGLQAVVVLRVAPISSVIPQNRQIFCNRTHTHIQNSLPLRYFRSNTN